MASKKSFDTFETKDYNSFKFLEDNREHDVRKALVESIKKVGLVCPIIVSSDGYIIDGQHRFAALQVLNLPIWYTVSYNYTSIQVLEANNNQKGWTLLDYIKRGSIQGNIDIKRLYKEILPEYNDFTIAGVAQIMGVKFSGYTRLIKDKTYSITYDSYKFGVSVLDSCREMDGIIVGKYTSIKFVRAMYMIMKQNTNFDIDRLISQATTAQKVRVYMNEKDTAESILECYNLGLRGPSRKLTLK